MPEKAMQIITAHERCLSPTVASVGASSRVARDQTRSFMSRHDGVTSFLILFGETKRRLLVLGATRTKRYNNRMEKNPTAIPDDPNIEQDALGESRKRQLTADQMVEFTALVGKEMQLRAQRSQPSAERSTTRSLQAKRRQEHGGLVLRRMRKGY